MSWTLENQLFNSPHCLLEVILILDWNMGSHSLPQTWLLWHHLAVTWPYTDCHMILLSYDFALTITWQTAVTWLCTSCHMTVYWLLHDLALMSLCTVSDWELTFLSFWLCHDQEIIFYILDRSQSSIRMLPSQYFSSQRAVTRAQPERKPTVNYRRRSQGCGQMLNCLRKVLNFSQVRCLLLFEAF